MRKEGGNINYLQLYIFFVVNMKHISHKTSQAIQMRYTSLGLKSLQTAPLKTEQTVKTI